MIYLIGSLRNESIVPLAQELRGHGYTVFDSWRAAGPRTDDHWQEYEKSRGRTYREAIQGRHARNVFDFDLRNLCASEAGVLVMPAGKSAHLELGFLAGKGIKTFVLFDAEPERYDIMYQFCTGICFSVEELVEALEANRIHKEER